MATTSLQLHGKYLTIQHIAEALDVKESTVSQWLWQTRTGNSGSHIFPEPDVKVGPFLQLWKQNTIRLYARDAGRACDIS